MEYLFILGRNRKLSITEIENYLEKENNRIQKSKIIENGFFVEVENPLKKNAIDSLGGTISIGEILVSGTKENFFKKLDNAIIYSGTSNKLSYTIWNFSSIAEELKEYLKQRFKEEKLKTSFKGLTGTIKSQEGEEDRKPSSKTLDEEYFIFENEKLHYFGKITSHCDYTSIENRDIKKPVRRESLAISPRLGKILINLAQLKENETLLDPFCGVGTVLQEALLQNINAIGIDKDKDAISGAKQNLKWFNFDEKKYKLINFDSSKVEIDKVTSIATEPDLGTTLKKIPTKRKAEETLKNFEKLMSYVINNLKQNVKKRIVFTSPYIRIGKKRVHCNIEEICNRTNCHLIGDGIPEYRENQIVGRMIYILEKN